MLFSWKYCYHGVISLAVHQLFRTIHWRSRLTVPLLPRSHSSLFSPTELCRQESVSESSRFYCRTCFIGWKMWLDSPDGGRRDTALTRSTVQGDRLLQQERFTKVSGGFAHSPIKAMKRELSRLLKRHWRKGTAVTTACFKYLSILRLNLKFRSPFEFVEIKQTLLQKKDYNWIMIFSPASCLTSDDKNKTAYKNKTAHLPFVRSDQLWGTGKWCDCCAIWAKLCQSA